MGSFYCAWEGLRLQVIIVLAAKFPMTLGFEA